jgi:molybdopterin synthase sulfur carrier subunit
MSPGCFAISASAVVPGRGWRGSANLRCAVNQQMVALDSPLGDGDEVAFFPPVTGG